MNSDIIFDQYSRYRLCSDILKQISTHSDTILDVGSGESCILDKFLPENPITFVDPILALQTGREKNKLAMSIFNKEFNSKKFDFIVCIDTFEHIPKDQRQDFLDKLFSLSKKGIILASPCNDEGNPLETDNHINSVFKNIFNKDYPWISNHFKNGLPSKIFLLGEFQKNGFYTHSFQNGNCNWMENLLPYILCINEYNQNHNILKNISKYFNENLYPYDHQPPCYRQIIVGTKIEVSKPEVQIPLNEQRLSDSKTKWHNLQNLLQLGFLQFLSENISEKNILENKLGSAISDVDVLQKINLQHNADKDKLNLEIKRIKEKLTHTKNDHGSEFNDYELELNNLRKSLQNSENMIKEIHQSFVFRMLHRFDKTIGKLLPIRPKKFLKSTKTFQKQSERDVIISNIQKNNLIKKDIIVFPIIDWNFRYQRPQHFTSKFAENGSRVFYLKTNLRQLESNYEIKQIQENIFEIELNFPTYFDIYKDTFKKEQLSVILKSFEAIKKDLNIDGILLVQFPTWVNLALEIRNKYNFKIVFDCLDDFVGFENVINERIKEEQLLFSISDLVLASSSNLFQKGSKISKNCLLLPNACDFKHFNKTPHSLALTNLKKPIIGYFGSIADWFDTELLEFAVKKLPNITFVLIGHTFGSDIRKLDQFENVHFLGEKSYSELPRYLHNFDACLIPFKNTPLIQATHPIKVYEYMAAGKPVVSTDMPELYSMSNLCYISKTKQEFVENIKKALNENMAIQKERILFASKNTWTSRFNTLYKQLESFDMDHHN